MKLTQAEKQELLNAKPIGYWSVLGGVEVKKIEYGVEDYVYCVSNAWGDKKNFHRLKIRYTAASKTSEVRSFVVLGGYKLYLDECIRMTICE